MGSRKLEVPHDHGFEIHEIPEVERDLKRIKVTNFEKSYELFKKVLPQLYLEREWWATHRIYPISGLKCKCESYIAKKLSVDGIRGNDHFRVIFTVSNHTITIIEVYSKNRKEIEDVDRICKNCQQVA